MDLSNNKLTKYTWTFKKSFWRLSLAQRQRKDGISSASQTHSNSI